MTKPAAELRVEPALSLLPISKRPRTLRVILTALIADATIAVAKFIGAALSGSAAMFAEALHSLADTANQVLLLLGRSLGARAPDASHPFGYGKERFFWPFVVSVVICSVGGVFSVLRGFHQFRSPHPLEHLELSYWILAAVFLLDGISWVIAWVELRRGGRRTSLWRALRESKFPSVFAVFLQDAAAVVGVVIAAAGLWLADLTQLWMIDGIASMLIGGLLFNISWVIASETKSLLIGESASPEVLEQIRRVIESTREVERVLTLLTMHLGPDEILVNLDLEFADGLTTGEIEAAIDQIERSIRDAIPEASKIFIEAESIAKVVRQAGQAQP